MILAPLFLALFLPVLSGCSKTEAFEETTKKVAVSEIKKSNISKTLNFTGNLEGIKETSLSIKSPGQIEDILVDISDEIKKGDLLAFLSANIVYTEKSTLGNVYQNSLQSFADTKNLMSQKVNEARVAKLTSEQNMLKVRQARDNELNLSENRIREAELSLDAAMIGKENLINTYEQRERDIMENTRSAIDQSLLLSSDVMAYLYSINSTEDKEDFEVDRKFVIKDMTLYIKTEQAFRKLQVSNSDLKFAINANKDAILYNRDLAETVLRDSKDLLYKMSLTIDSSVEHVDMNRVLLDQYRNGVTTYSMQVESLLLSQDSGVALGILGVRQALENLAVDKQNKIKESDKQIELIKQKLVLLKSTDQKIKDDFENEIKIIDLQIKQAGEALLTAKVYLDAQTQNSKTNADIALGNLNMANTKLSDTRLTAPYDAVVVEKYVQIGEVVGAGTPVLKVADISKMKLVVYIPEAYIRNFQKGDRAVIKVDSFPNEKFEVFVDRISPKSEESSRKVRVEFIFDNPGYLKIGMQANLEIELEEPISDMLVVDSRAVKKYYDNDIVFLVVDDMVKSQKIEIGIVNDEYIQILSGAEEGAKVVVEGSDGLRDGDKVEMLKN